jgi:hypothetical protein
MKVHDHSLLARRLAFGCRLAVLLVGITAVLLGGASLSLQAQTGSDYADRPPRQCRSCHTEIYREWADSQHALTAASDNFERVWERARKDTACLTCHSPAYDADTGRRGEEGVNCGACHRTLDPTRRRDGSLTYHGPMSTLRTAADCGSCHGADHAVTFIEWEDSAHNGARTVDCLTCHLPHSGEITAPTGEALCGSCHLQPVPEVNPHMHVEGGCTDCHPAPVSVDNVHMHDAGEDIDCIDCHIATELDQYGRFKASTGHSMVASLTACLDCHGSLHALKAAPEP